MAFTALYRKTISVVSKKFDPGFRIADEVAWTFQVTLIHFRAVWLYRHLGLLVFLHAFCGQICITSKFTLSRELPANFRNNYFLIFLNRLFSLRCGYCVVVTIEKIYMFLMVSRPHVAPVKRSVLKEAAAGFFQTVCSPLLELIHFLNVFLVPGSFDQLDEWRETLQPFCAQTIYEFHSC